MHIDRSNPLRLSALAFVSCKLAHQFRELSALGRPSLGDLASEVAQQLASDEFDQVQADASTDFYCWAIAPGADAATLLAARAIGWLQLWSELPWGRAQLADVGIDADQVAQAMAAGAEADTVAWIDPAVTALLVTAQRAAAAELLADID